LAVGFPLGKKALLANFRERRACEVRRIS
jgi:hypothetical protein